MAKLTIGDRTVTVDDNFRSLSPEQQAATVEEIASSLGLGGSSDGKPDPGIAAYTADVLSGDPERARQAIDREQGRQAGIKASVGQTIGAGLQKGTLRNFSDEVAGLADASGLPVGTPPILTAPVGGIRMGLDALGLTSGDATKRYEQTRDQARGFNEGMTEAHPVASYGSQMAGAIASPARTPVGMAAEGALYGLGEGEGLSDRLKGAGVGAGAGYVLGKVVDKIMPGQTVAAPNAVTEAAGRQGIDVPVAVATDSMATQRLASAARNVPLAGDPLVRASERTIQQLGQKASDVAQSMGGAGMEQAGETASSGITGWVKGKSGALVDKAYRAVDDLVNPSVKTELSKTRDMVAEIAAKRSEAGLPSGTAIDTVLDAVQRPGGLTYEGIKTLRSRIGEMSDNGLLPADMSKADLKRIYGALTDDLKSAVQNAGGGDALAKFNRANALNRLVAQRRENLARIVGKDGGATPAQVYDRLIAAAGSKSRADTSLLAQARKVIGPDDWNEFSSALVGRLGRDVEDNFSPQRFLTDYGKLSDGGKNILFGTNRELRQALDDLATIAGKFKELQKFANPSGTAQNVAGGGIGAGLVTHPIATIATLVGGNVFSRIVARPATAKAMVRYLRAQELLVKKPTRGALGAIQAAAKQFSGAMGRELGISLDPGQLLGGLKPGYADGQNDNRLGVGQ